VITEFPLPNTDSFPLWITTGPDGNLWFTEEHGNRIGRITPSGLITEFAVPTASSIRRLLPLAQIVICGLRNTVWAKIGKAIPGVYR